jgi:hypothetical protein
MLNFERKKAFEILEEGEGEERIREGFPAP